MTQWLSILKSYFILSKFTFWKVLKKGQQNLAQAQTTFECTSNYNVYDLNSPIPTVNCDTPKGNKKEF